VSQHNHLYQCKAWKDLRRGQLSREPLCRYCKSRGIIEPATICDHVIPHRGDVAMFWAGPFQSLCKACHDSDKAREEQGGEAKPFIGLDGWPA
jgi:hypothetical protein